MITVDSLYKEFPDKILFKHISFKLKDNMRVAIVGPNGSGKSTLLKIILNFENYDSGKVDVGRSISIGYLPQEIVEGTEKTIIEEVLNSFPEISTIENEIKLLSDKIEDDPSNKKNINQLSNLQDKFQELGGWEIEKNAKVILGGLGFKEEQFDMPFNSFSGGWRMRCLLAGILLRKPNYLFFDEPTNHLDLEAIIWMEDFLSKWRGGLIMISHDREFLNKSVNNILELDRGNAKLYKGNYNLYLKTKEEDQIQYIREYKNQQKKITHLEQFIERFRYKDSKAKQVQSRVKELEKLDIIKPIDVDKSLINIKIPQSDRGPLKVVELKNVKKEYGKILVYDSLELLIERGQKVALVGPNGSGKTTMLKLLAQVEDLSAGELVFGPGIKIKYYAQHQLEILDPNSTIYESISSISSGWSETEIRSFLGSFLFKNDTIQKKVKVLSGGEKARLALARLLVDPAHLLLLDEPTNHLDMQSRDVIEFALKKYSGSIVSISHDRHFLNAVTNHTIEVGKLGVKHYYGNYDYYLWKKENDSIGEKTIESGKKEINKKINYQERKKIKNRINKIKQRLIKIDIELDAIKVSLNDKEIESDYKKIDDYINNQNLLENEYIELLDEKEILQKKIL